MSYQVICSYCNNEAKLVTGEVIYPHRPDLATRMYWSCFPCKAYVGCHIGTVIPMGSLATTELRLWRQEVHKVFDPIWKNLGIKDARSVCYIVLARLLKIKTTACHISRFDIETCQKVYQLCVTGELLNEVTRQRNNVGNTKLNH